MAASAEDAAMLRAMNASSSKPRLQVVALACLTLPAVSIITNISCENGSPINPPLIRDSVVP
jgi:hypothetical protein